MPNRFRKVVKARGIEDYYKRRKDGASAHNSDLGELGSHSDEIHEKYTFLSFSEINLKVDSKLSNAMCFI